MDYAVYCTTLNADFKNDFVVAGIDMQNNVVEIGIKNLDSEKETRYKSLMGHLDGITMVNATAIIDD